MTYSAGLPTAIASTMSLRHSTALNLSLRLCLKLWMTHLSGTYWCSHLFNPPLAELTLQPVASQYLGKANILSLLASRGRLEAYRASFVKGMSLWLPLVFSPLHGWGFKSIWGIRSSSFISSLSKPAASLNLMPVSLIRAINQRISSSISLHRDCTSLMSWMDINCLDWTFIHSTIPTRISIWLDRYYVE